MTSDSVVYPWNRGNTNVLLTKDDVGKSKPTTYKLPGGDISYGKALPRAPEGAKESTLLHNCSLINLAKSHKYPWNSS
jgi:hypothetical protein